MVAVGGRLYDKAADAVYNTTHEGGALHRLFDGNHAVGGLWDVRGVIPEKQGY